ncbi:hypothetical protein AC27_1991 [Escherichia coli 1-182-04_S3_C2]|nr:hypothetical protein AC27_1991 [Escherichia coli 1-182-04_S3_C2]
MSYKLTFLQVFCFQFFHVLPLIKNYNIIINECFNDEMALVFSIQTLPQTFLYFFHF